MDYPGLTWHNTPCKQFGNCVKNTYLRPIPPPSRLVYFASCLPKKSEKILSCKSRLTPRTCQTSIQLNLTVTPHFHRPKRSVVVRVDAFPRLRFAPIPKIPQSWFAAYHIPGWLILKTRESTLFIRAMVKKNDHIPILGDCNQYNHYVFFNH